MCRPSHERSRKPHLALSRCATMQMTLIASLAAIIVLHLLAILAGGLRWCRESSWPQGVLQDDWGRLPMQDAVSGQQYILSTVDLSHQRCDRGAEVFSCRPRKYRLYLYTYNMLIRPGGNDRCPTSRPGAMPSCQPRTDTQYRLVHIGGAEESVVHVLLLPWPRSVGGRCFFLVLPL